MRRVLAAIVLVWALGFLWFAGMLPQPAGAGKTDAVIVPTGGTGRIAYALEVLERGSAPQMLVSGVDSDVKPGEFAAEFEVDEATMQCCITLGFKATDTHSNASEIADWARARKLTSIRLVTSDWHMRRAAFELEQALPLDITILRDAQPTEPGLTILFIEYHKLLASWVASLAP